LARGLEVRGERGGVDKVLEGVGIWAWLAFPYAGGVSQKA